MAVVVLVVGRHRLQAVPDLELHVLGQQFSRRKEQLSVPGVLPQAAGDAERPSLVQLLTRYSSAVSATSFASAGSPFGSGLFQLSPKAVRSIGALEAERETRAAVRILGGLADGSSEDDRQRRRRGSSGRR